MKAVNVDDVLRILDKYGRYIFVTDEKKYSSMVDEIANLKALEQEPKSEWEHDHEILKAYSDGANEMLDKIRDEIKGLPRELPTDAKNMVRRTRVLDIIDKYKAESEET